VFGKPCGKIGCKYSGSVAVYSLELGADAQLEPLTNGKLKETP
jgi:hypothetical protein